MLKKKKRALDFFRKSRVQEATLPKSAEVRQEHEPLQINRPVEFAASGRAHSLFFTPESEGKDFSYATPTSVVSEGALIIVSGERRKVEAFSDQE